MGYVGRNLANQLESKATVVTYDIRDDDEYPSRSFETCDIAFVCVDTPMRDDGSCDTSHVEEAVHLLPSGRIVIRSTIPPGTTDRLARSTGKEICHFPEFYGEGEHSGLPRPQSLSETGYCIVGGPLGAREDVIQILMPFYGPATRWHSCSSVESELIKYMENCFLATKVAFVNEFYDICTRFDANWTNVREGWLLDPRIGRSHTAVFKDDRGFDGNCLPKDLAAIVHASNESGYSPTLLRAVAAANLEQQAQNDSPLQ